MNGVYQHCGEQHLHRYLAEFDFRFNERAALGVNDSKRATTMFKGIVGKRLTYRRIRSADERCAPLDHIMVASRAIETDYLTSNNFAFGGINMSLIFRRV